MKPGDKVDPKRAFELARTTSKLSCPHCEQPLILYVMGSALEEDEMRQFHGLYLRLMREGRIGLDSVETAAHEATEGRAVFTSEISDEEGA